MYYFRVNDRVKLAPSANLTFTEPGLSVGQCGRIAAYTPGMYDPVDEMYNVIFEGESFVRYICFSDLQRI